MEWLNSDLVVLVVCLGLKSGWGSLWFVCFGVLIKFVVLGLVGMSASSGVEWCNSWGIGLC